MMKMMTENGFIKPKYTQSKMIYKLQTKENTDFVMISNRNQMNLSVFIRG